MFDFLFSNPIIIIILIGIISSIFKNRNKPNQKKTGQPQAPKPVWKEVIREIQEEWLEEKKKTPRPIQEGKRVISTEKNELDAEAERKRVAELKRLQQEYEGIREYSEKDEGAITSIVAAESPLLETISDMKSPVYNKELSFGKQELIQGIIMSEVLGPPKAKRMLQQTRR